MAEDTMDLLNDCQLKVVQCKLSPVFQRVGFQR
jgi:hypothetical protein